MDAACMVAMAELRQGMLVDACRGHCSRFLEGKKIQVRSMWRLRHSNVLVSFRWIRGLGGRPPWHCSHANALEAAGRG